MRSRAAKALAPARRGFTLIELLVVIIIVAILASVAVPMMKSASKRAIAAEAITALGTIRTAMRLYKIEYGAYPTHDWPDGQKIFEVQGLGFKPGDLNGLYFSEDCYWVRSNEAVCEVDASRPDKSPKAHELDSWQLKDGPQFPEREITLSEDGTLGTNVKGLGF